MLQACCCYRLRARVRSERLTTDEGVFVRLRREGRPAQAGASPGAGLPARPAVDVATTAVLGTNPWHEVAQPFCVEGDSGLASLSLERRRSLKFDQLVDGVVWIDDVEVAPVPTSSTGEGRTP